MKKLFCIAAFILFAVIIVLEALPYGAVLNFATAPDAGGTAVRETFSYFSLTPFGYANFGPLLTAVLSAALPVLFVIWLCTRKKGLITAAFICSVAALIWSLTPLLYGISYFSVIGAVISVLLAASAVIMWRLRKA